MSTLNLKQAYREFPFNITTMHSPSNYNKEKGTRSQAMRGAGLHSHAKLN